MPRELTLAEHDAQPCHLRGWHDSRVPVCDCGYEWTHWRALLNRDGTAPVQYHSKHTVDLYHARHGVPSEPRHQFKPVPADSTG